MRNVWVYAFESKLGEFRRSLDQHGNGKSEGSNMLRREWLKIICVFITDSVELKKWIPNVKKNSVVELMDGNFYAIKSKQKDIMIGFKVLKRYDVEHGYFITSLSKLNQNDPDIPITFDDIKGVLIGIHKPDGTIVIMNKE